MKFLNCYLGNDRAAMLRSNDGSGKLKQGENGLLPVIDGSEAAGDLR